MNENPADGMLRAPLLGAYKHNPKAITFKHIFRIEKDDLLLFFNKKNIRMPDNDGECRTSLNILKDCGYNDQLCKRLCTDKDTGIIGDAGDLNRRRKIFG